MDISSGTYVGTGAYRLDGETSAVSIECSLELQSNTKAFVVNGYWHRYSKKVKKPFSIDISKFSGSSLENVVMNYDDYTFTGALSSIEDYATGVFTTASKLEVLGVTILTIQGGYKISGTIISNPKAMFDIKLLSTDPHLSRSNVVSLKSSLG